MKIIKIYSDTCGPCKVLDNNLKAVGIPYESLNIASAEAEDIIEKYEIRSVPTLLAFNNDGELHSKNVGVVGVDYLKSLFDEISRS